MKNKSSGWTEYKELAKASGVSYSTYYRRIQEGMNPVDAATKRPVDPRDVILNGFKNGTIKPSVSKSQIRER